MATYRKTEVRDHDANGLADSRTVTEDTFDAGKLIFSAVFTDYDADGVANSIRHRSLAYDAAGRCVGETSAFDQTADGVFDLGSTTTRAWHADGRIDWESTANLYGDQVYHTAYTYDGAHLVQKHTSNYVNGELFAPDYKTETWAYDAAGRQTMYQIDDPFFYDCVITRTSAYKNGRLMTVKEQNEIRFADRADPYKAYTDESFTYNKDGTLKTKTDWADYSEHGWFQRVDTSFTWRAGYDSQRITYDFEGDSKPERVKFVENWYDANGRLTHTLVSHDIGGDGGRLQGGYDTRDLFVKSYYADGTLASETHDYGADGVFEYQMTNELLMA